MIILRCKHYFINFFKPFIELLLYHALKMIVSNPKICGRKNQKQEPSGMSASHCLMTGDSCLLVVFFMCCYVCDNVYPIACIDELVFAQYIKGEAKTSQSSYRAGEDMLLLSGDSHVIKGDIEEAFSNEDTNGETSGCGYSKRHRCKSSKGRKIPRVDSKNHHDELIKEMANGIITASRPSSHVDYSNCLDIVMAMKELSAVEKIHAAEYLKDEKDALMFLKFDKECRLAWLKMKLGKS